MSKVSFEKKPNTLSVDTLTEKIMSRSEEKLASNETPLSPDAEEVVEKIKNDTKRVVERKEKSKIARKYITVKVHEDVWSEFQENVMRRKISEMAHKRDYTLWDACNEAIELYNKKERENG